MADCGSVRNHTLDEVVRELYGSLTESVSFDRGLKLLGSVFRSHVVALHTQDSGPSGDSLTMHGPLSRTEFSQFEADYAAGWSEQSLWMTRGISTLMSQGYGSGDAVVSASDLLASPYFQYFLRPLGIRYGVGIALHRNGSSALSIAALNRAESAGPFSDEEMAMVGALRPHLVNAFAIHQRLVTLGQAAVSLRASFDRAPFGMMVLDAMGRVVEHNAEAARLFALEAGIELAPNGTLRVSRSASSARLRAALLRLAGDPLSAPGPECLVICAVDGFGPGALVLHLCAFPPSVSPVVAGRGRILGFLYELSRKDEAKLSERLLQSALGITPMEAKVAIALRDHHDPAEVALSLGVAVSTVRTHLLHLYRKTGTSRQSELLRLVTRFLDAAPRGQ